MGTWGRCQEALPWDWQTPDSRTGVKGTHLFPDKPLVEDTLECSSSLWLGRQWRDQASCLSYPAGMQVGFQEEEGSYLGQAPVLSTHTHAHDSCGKQDFTDGETETQRG